MENIFRKELTYDRIKDMNNFVGNERMPLSIESQDELKINPESFETPLAEESVTKDPAVEMAKLDQDIITSRRNIDETRSGVVEIRNSLELPDNPDLDIPSIKMTESKLAKLEARKKNLDIPITEIDTENMIPTVKSESAWGEKPIFPESEPFDWNKVPESPSNLSEQAKRFQDYDKKINDISNSLRLARFQKGDPSTSQENIKTLDQIDLNIFNEVLNSDYKYRCLEKISELKSSLGYSQDSFEVNQKISNQLSKIGRENPELLSLKDFYKDAKEDAYTKEINAVEYQGNYYSKTDVVEGATALCFDSLIPKSQISGDKDIETNQALLLKVNENLGTQNMGEIIDNQLSYENTLHFISTFGNEVEKERFQNAIIDKMTGGSDSDADKVLDSKYAFIKWNGESIAKNKIESDFGISDFDLDVWRGDRIKYHENLNIMKHIESMEEGSVKKLYSDYGIKEFHRYPEEILMDQIKDENEQKPYGLVIFPRADHNDAFDTQKGMLSHLYLQTRGKFGLKIAECDSKFDMARKFINLDNKFGEKNKTSFVILGGHGNGDSISLGSGDPRLATKEKWEKDRDKKMLFSVESNNPTFKKANEKYLDKDAEIMFLSCSTGEEGGIAEKFSESFDKKIVAPKIPINRMDLNVKYDADGKPHFEAIYNNDKTLSSEFLSGVLQNKG